MKNKLENTFVGNFNRAMKKGDVEFNMENYNNWLRVRLTMDMWDEAENFKNAKTEEEREFSKKADNTLWEIRHFIDFHTPDDFKACLQWHKEERLKASAALARPLIVRSLKKPKKT